MPADIRHQGFSPSARCCWCGRTARRTWSTRSATGESARSSSEHAQCCAHSVSPPTPCGGDTGGPAKPAAASGLRLAPRASRIARREESSHEPRRHRAGRRARDAIRHQLFIGGRFVDAESGETLATLNPHDNSTIAEVALAGKADVDRAVAAAQARVPGLEPHGRGRARAADPAQARRPDRGRRRGAGAPRDRSTPAIRCATRASSTCRARRACFRYFGGMADKFEGSVMPVDAGLPQLRRCASRWASSGQIVPWNFPLMFTSWKMAPGAGRRQRHRHEAGGDHAALDAARSPS